MTILWFDCETYSEADLKKVGTHAYAEHPSTEITVAQWAIGDGEPEVLDITALDGFYRSNPMRPLFDLLQDPTVTVVAHNSAFDRTLLRHVWGIDVPVERWLDTMVQAMAHGLPGSLDKLGGILGLEADEAKDKRGRELIHLFCKPRPKGHKLRRATRDTHPTEWAEFLEYSRQDIVAMRAIHRRLPRWNYAPGHPELALWHLDQRVNDRGFAVDTELARAAIDAVAAEQARLKSEVTDATDGAVTNASQRDELLSFILLEHGVSLPDMRADTLERRAKDPELPEAVRRLLEIRLEATKTSTAKYKALVNAVSADGRLRNTMQFCGAQRTGRVAHRLFQPGNMPRPSPGFDGEAQEAAIESLKAGAADLVYDNVMRLTSDCIRGTIIAPPGRKLVVADLANIEGRALAWLASEEWKLDAFRAFDRGEGADIYKLAYAKSFGTSPDKVDKQQRQIGKVQELACLAGDTPVVTKRGIIRLDSVTKVDEVWDGVEWVKHQGLVERGVRSVVLVGGTVSVTPDHLVLVGRSWTPAQTLASSESTLRQAVETASANLPSWVLSGIVEAPATSTWFAFSALAALRRTWSSTTTSAKALLRGAVCALARLQASGGRSTTATLTSFLTSGTAFAFSAASAQPSTAATTRTTPATRTTGSAASRSTPLGAKTGSSFSRTWSACRGGMTRFWRWIGGTSTEATSPATCGSSPSRRTALTSGQSSNCSVASQALKPVYDLLNAGPRHRFTVMTSMGPLLVHNCGYEGGVGAYLTMGATYNFDIANIVDVVKNATPAAVWAKALDSFDWFRKKGLTYGLPIEHWTACRVLVDSWREAHAKTKELWHGLKDAYACAVAHPGETFSAGRWLKVRRDGAWLRIRLPSGRYLCYLQPEVDDSGQCSYMGINQYTRQWARIKTHGGKLVENVTQAVARDVLFANMPRIEAAGYEILVSIHDELLTETPDTDAYSSGDLAALMSTVPEWAAGLPLAAAGFEAYRYEKQ